jgi:hypothetical protein
MKSFFEEGPVFQPFWPPPALGDEAWPVRPNATCERKLMARKLLCSLAGASRA